MRRSSLPLSLAFVALACSACTALTGVPVEPTECRPEMMEQVPVTAVDSLTPRDSLPTVYVGYCVM